MDTFPTLPDSAVVSRDGNEVFVSFHWEFDSPRVARYSSNKLAEWLHKALLDMGAAVVEEVDGGLDE